MQLVEEPTSAVMFNQHGCAIRIPVGQEAMFDVDDECPYVSSSPIQIKNGRIHSYVDPIFIEKAY